MVFGVFLIVVSICGLTSGGHVYVRDGAAMYMMSNQLLETGQIDVPLHQNTVGGKFGPDGRYFMPFGFLQPVFGMPFIYFGKILASKFSVQYLTFFAATWLNWIMTGLLATLVFGISRLWQLSRLQALAAAFTIVMASPFWVYSQTFFAEPMAGLFTLASFALLLISKDVRHPVLPIICAGILAGTITWLRPLCGLIIPVLVVYILLCENNRKNPSVIRAVKHLVAFGIPTSMGIAGYLTYNYYRFGSILETGYDKLPDGSSRSFTLPPLYGAKVLLCSPGKSIFIFFPVLILMPVGIFLMIKTARKAEVITITISGLLYLVVLSSWSRVEGGVTWGPRLVLPVLPLLFLILLPIFKSRQRAIRFTLIALICLGVGLQGLGVIVNFATIVYQHIDGYFSPEDGVYVYSFNPISKHIRAIRQTIDNPFRFSQRPQESATWNKAQDQINPMDGFDLWWLHFYRDGVSSRFIVTTLTVLGLILLAGILCILPAFFIRK